MNARERARRAVAHLEDHDGAIVAPKSYVEDVVSKAIREALDEVDMGVSLKVRQSGGRLLLEDVLDVILSVKGT